MKDLCLRGDCDSVLIAEQSEPPEFAVYLDINDEPIWLRRAEAQRLRDWLHELLGELTATVDDGK